MGIRQRNWYDGSGRRQKCRRWFCRFQDHTEQIREIAAFHDEKASAELDSRLHRLVSIRAAGAILTPDILRWLGGLPNRIRVRLVEFDLVEPHLGDNRTLTQHLDDFKAAMIAKGCTVSHAALVESRAKKVFRACRFRSYCDIQATRVQQHLAELRQSSETKQGLSIQTTNFYLAACKQFCRWLVGQRIAQDNPLGMLSAQNVRLDRRHDRRALTDDECRRLLTATTTGPVRSGLTGPVRALGYRLILESGLRLREFSSLTPTSFDLAADPPRLLVQAAYSKHRRDDTIILQPDLAEELRRHLATRLPASPAFPLPRSKNCRAAMIQADLKAAGIPYQDAAGRFADWHALRHTFVSALARGGVHPRVAQSLARHSTITLTMDVYTHVVQEQEIDALKRLPDLSLPAKTVESKESGADAA